MASVEIFWSAHCDGSFIAKDQTTLLPGLWADCEDNAESAVVDICEEFFDRHVWDAWIGLDDDDWSVTVIIHSPASIAGDYFVSLERVTKAHARKAAESGSKAA